jgi:hypothetical protein
MSRVIDALLEAFERLVTTTRDDSRALAELLVQRPDEPFTCRTERRMNPAPSLGTGSPQSIQTTAVSQAARPADLQADRRRVLMAPRVWGDLPAPWWPVHESIQRPP